MKIVFLENGCFGHGMDFSLFSNLGEVVFQDYTRVEDVPEYIKDADIIVVNKLPMNKVTLEKAKKLKLICVTATGTNNVDFEYTNSRGITVTNVKEYSATTVMEPTFALYFSLAKHIGYFDRCVKDNGYYSTVAFVNNGPEIHDLSGMTW